jgi:eukaryotic-like serine/threonine-protein kinase
MHDEHLLELGLKLGYVDQAQIELARADQRERAVRGDIKSVWSILQAQGVITRPVARELLQYLHSTEVRALEIDGYAITSRIGKGGMGTVYEAVNTAGEEVAIKLLPPAFSEDAECAYRFRYEAQLIRKLHHPHIVRGLSSGLVEGQHYVIMELVKGPSIADVLRRHGPLDEATVMRLLAQIASALSYAWGRNILHRDIKPANIILGPARLRHRGEPFCAKLCDFGLAKLWAMTEEGRTYWLGRITGQHCTMGTPEYMSPEQVLGQELDHRSDMYNLGATAFHALIGNAPFQGPAASVLEQQRSAAIDLDLLAERGISPQGIAVIAGMLRKDPQQRWPDWETFTAQLQALPPMAMAGRQP